MVFVLFVVLVVKVLDQKCIRLKLLGPKNCVKKNVRPKKFGQNWVSNLIWLNVTRTYFSWTNVTVTVGICSKRSQELTFQILVKIGSVIAEILPLWTNVDRTNVAWTNVTRTVDTFYMWSQEPTFKVWSKSAQ